MLKYEKWRNLLAVLKNRFKLETQKLENLKSFNVKPINTNKIQKKLKVIYRKYVLKNLINSNKSKNM